MAKPNFHHVRRSTVVKQPNGQRVKLGGYRPDHQYASDKHYSASAAAIQNLPPSVDLRPYMTPVENQADTNSCTANAMAGAYEYLAKRLKGHANDVSRLFIYYNARDLDGDTTVDEGSYLRSCIKVLREYGACSEHTWAFDPEQLFETPSDEAYEEASYFLIEDAYRIDIDLDAMRSCLAEGYPFTFGLVLFSSFQKAGSRGLVPMPNPDNEQHDGGHAMLCVGYSDADQVFIVRNSWGEEWGDRGYCYIPYDYMTNSDLNHDLWAIRRVSESDVDLSEGIQGSVSSLFDLATAAIAHARQHPGDNAIADDQDDYQVEYEEQLIYVNNTGFVPVDQVDNLSTLYEEISQTFYAEYDIETTEESVETEDSYEEESDEEYDDSDETEDSYEEESDEEEYDDSDETEDNYEEESNEEYDDSDETEDSYEEESDEEEYDDSDETEDSYEEESDEEYDESEEIEDSYEEEYDEGDSYEEE